MFFNKAPIFVLVVFLNFLFLPVFHVNAQVVEGIAYPVLDDGSYFYAVDGFGDPRDGGARTHEGVDIIGERMTPLVSTVNGVVRSVQYPEPSWGYSVTIQGDDGYRYVYIHMNNDTPGTDDGNGGPMFAYAPYMERGNRVAKGQLIGWMGDSGNAENSVPQLHFEILDSSRDPIDPYPSLQAASILKESVPAPKQDNELLPFGEFSGGASVAVGEFGLSSLTELVVGAGPGGGPHVRIIDENGKRLGAFFAYGQDFKGGVDVASGDIDGDGKDEIITGAGPGGGPHVRIFNEDGTPYSDGFFAYDAGWGGGVDVSVTDKTSSQDARIIVSPGPGGGPHVRVMNLSGEEMGGFFAYDEEFRGGVKIDARLKMESSSGYDSYGRISSGSVLEIFTSPARDGGPDFKKYTMNTDGHVELDSSDSEFERWWQGGYRIAVGKDSSWVVSGPERRVSVREVFTTSSSFDSWDWGDRWWRD